VILKEGRIFFNGKMESLKNKLKFKYILELRFHYLSADNKDEIKKYCNYREIRILDSYQRYMMFALSSTRSRDALFNLLEKLNLRYEEIGFREPNLDEIFLKA
jgi:ABC-type multidrug transport system ATPase subunit